MEVNIENSDRVEHHQGDGEVLHHDNFHDCDEQSISASVSAHSNETEVINTISKHMYLLNADIQKSMQNMKGQILDVVQNVAQDITERVDILEKEMKTLTCSSIPNERRASGIELPTSQSFEINENKNVNENSIVTRLEKGQIANSGAATLKLKPQNYDGTDDFEEYMTQFQILADLNGWNYKTKALVLASCLTGPARYVLTELDKHACRDFQSLEDTLRQRYGSLNRSEIFKSELQNRVRGRNETIPELAANIKKLTRKSYPYLGPNVSDQLSVDYFIEAIPETEIRLKLKEASLKTMLEAENLAVKLEALRVADKHRARPVRNLDFTPENDNKVESNDDKTENQTPRWSYDRSNRGRNSNRRNHSNYRSRQNYGSRNGFFSYGDRSNNQIRQNDSRAENYQALSSRTGTQH